VHEVTVRNGVKVERHLCEQHAVEAGIAVQPAQQLTELIKQHLASAGQIARGQVCPTCRMTFAEFKQHGLLGCADCYKTFEAQLAPLIERAHEGGVHHVGKIPKRLGIKTAPPPQQDPQLAERARRLAQIRAELERAVKAEEYERAAKLRDELRKLGEGAGQGESREP
jgi:protein arginine kinase activator